MDSPEGRASRILLARITHPGVFDEYWQLVGTIRAIIESGESAERPGVLQGDLRQYARKGPESRFVEVSGEAKLTKHGWVTERRSVERYSEKEVAAGKARNGAARLAILEHFLKLSDEGSEYEQVELIELVHDMWMEENGEDPRERVDPGLLAVVMRNEGKTWPVRITAAIYLPDQHRQELLGFLHSVISSDDLSNRDRHYVWTYRALRKMRFHGGEEDLARLKRLAPREGWRRELVLAAITRLSAKLGSKDRR
jgi:hypothetical protein